MAHHVLTWDDAGLVTVDLEDDRRVVMVFDSEELAGLLGQAVATQAARLVQVAEIDAPSDGIQAAIEVLLGISQDDTQVTVTFAGETLFESIADQLR